MYRLSNRAVEDFESIYEYTWKRFGPQQADKYTNELSLLFQSLAIHPLMGHDCSKIMAGVRQFNHRQHVIFYHYTDYGVLIIRILHQLMDPMLHVR